MMHQQPFPLSRRRVVPAGAGAAAAPLGPSLGGGTARAAGRSAARAVDSLQPYASYWFPDSLPSGMPGAGITWRSPAAWTPEGDRDLAFNTATVPLAERCAPVAAHATARSGQARISALAAFDHTAGEPSQGSLTHLPPGRFHAADDRFWSGAGLDPARPAGTGGGRRAPAVADRSTITALPFATTFNTGHGPRRYEDGAATSDAPWNLGLQDRLPPRRRPVRTTGRRRTVSLDFAGAWRGGSRLLVRGVLDAPATVGPFPTRLPVGAGTVVEFAHRADAASGPVTVEVAVALHEPSAPGEPAPYTGLPAGTVEPGDGRRTATVRLGSPGSGTLYALGVRLTGRGGAPVAWRLGSPAVREAAGRPAAPGGLTVTDAATADGTTAVAAGLAARRRSGPPLRAAPCAPGRRPPLPRRHPRCGLPRPRPEPRTGRAGPRAGGPGRGRTVRRIGTVLGPAPVVARRRHPCLSHPTLPRRNGATPHA